MSLPLRGVGNPISLGKTPSEQIKALERLVASYIMPRSSAPDAPDKWLTDADVVPRRFDLFAMLEPMQDRDGQALAKKFDQWIKHSTFFNDIKLKSLAAVRSWLSGPG